MSKAPRHKIGVSLAGSAGIVVMGLILLEVTLRIAGFYYTYMEKMDGHYKSYYHATQPSWYWGYQPYDSIIDRKPEFTYRSRANNFGFRDRDFDTTASEHP